MNRLLWCFCLSWVRLRPPLVTRFLDKKEETERGGRREETHRGGRRVTTACSRTRTAFQSYRRGLFIRGSRPRSARTARTELWLRASRLNQRSDVLWSTSRRHCQRICPPCGWGTSVCRIMARKTVSRKRKAGDLKEQQVGSEPSLANLA